MQAADSLVDFLARDRTRFFELLYTLQRDRCKLLCRPVAGEIGLRAVEFRFVRPRINPEENISRVNRLALDKFYFVNVPGHAWSNLYDLRRLETTGEFVPVADLTLDDPCDGHFTSGRYWRRLGTARHEEHDDRARRGESRPCRGQMFYSDAHGSARYRRAVASRHALFAHNGEKVIFRR